MTRDKAIEILTAILFNEHPRRPPDEEDAITLGIEALKSVRTGRKVGLHYDAPRLPGETED